MKSYQLSRPPPRPLASSSSVAGAANLISLPPAAARGWMPSFSFSPPSPTKLGFAGRGEDGSGGGGGIWIFFLPRSDGKGPDRFFFSFCMPSSCETLLLHLYFSGTCSRGKVSNLAWGTLQRVTVLIFEPYRKFPAAIARQGERRRWGIMEKLC